VIYYTRFGLYSGRINGGDKYGIICSGKQKKNGFFRFKGKRQKQQQYEQQDEYEVQTACRKDYAGERDHE